MGTGFRRRTRRYAAGKSSWFFITVPRELSDHLRVMSKGISTAFGSLAVRAKIGNTQWKTSLFRDGKTQTYFLPVKADVRNAEGLATGVPIRVVLMLDV